MLYQRSRTGRWRLSREEWKASWAADRKSPRYWLLYAGFFAVVLVSALFLPDDEPLGWRIFVVAALGLFTMVGVVQLVRSLHHSRESRV